MGESPERQPDGRRGVAREGVRKKDVQAGGILMGPAELGHHLMGAWQAASSASPPCRTPSLAAVSHHGKPFSWPLLKQKQSEATPAAQPPGPPPSTALTTLAASPLAPLPTPQPSPPYSLGSSVSCEA